MKAIKKVVLGLVFLFALQSSAQVSVNVNIGTPPPWGPIGYAEARFYYIPDIQVYYDIHTAMFIYHGPRGWIHVHNLPNRYAHFDLYSGYKVVLDYRGGNPYHYYDVHKVKYPKGYKKYKQKPFKMKGDNGNHHGHAKGGPEKIIHSNKAVKFNRDGNPGHGGGKHGGKHGGGNGKGKNK
ncbi:hypothetical protein ABGT15_05855 [Flavobacterium enshiense]|uniref:hypothetical protein n=1 Tax=Flavobacterium enshiense TaxID=1341165 RepID=UPI00345D1A01